MGNWLEWKTKNCLKHSEHSPEKISTTQNTQESSLRKKKKAVSAFTQGCKMKVPAGNTWTAFWEGPLVGTPVWGAAFGGAGCKGRAAGWAGALSPVTGVWFCFLLSALKQSEVVGNSKQQLEHRRVLKSFFPLCHSQISKEYFLAWHFFDLFILQTKLWKTHSSPLSCIILNLSPCHTP